MAVSNDTTNTTVHRVNDEGSAVLSTERATCANCGTEGWRGDWPDEGGIVPLDCRLLCDTCAVMGEPVTEEEAHEALAEDGSFAVNAGDPHSEDYDEGNALDVRGDELLVSWEGSGDRRWVPLEGLRHGHPGLWSQGEEA